jgi:hypothetical protein
MNIENIEDKRNPIHIMVKCLILNKAEGIMLFNIASTKYRSMLSSINIESS